LFATKLGDNLNTSW